VIHRKYSNKYLYYKPNFIAVKNNRTTKHKSTYTPNLVKYTYIEDFPYVNVVIPTKFWDLGDKG